jgi:GABA(A) receptor-associated protein
MFKDTNTFEKRCEESGRIRKKYPTRIPVIVEKDLVPQDLSVGEFMFVIRKRIKLSPDKSIYLFIDGSLQNTAATIGKIYEEHMDKDGFLYILYYGESTFGNNRV